MCPRRTVPYVLKAGMVLHLRVHTLHHRMLLLVRGCRRASCSLLVPAVLRAFSILIVVVARSSLIREVRRPLMLMRAAVILKPSYDLVDIR